MRKFLPAVTPQGLVLYNGAVVPEGCERLDVRLLALPFSKMADEAGDPRAANIAMLGALREAGNIPLEHEIADVLRRVVRSPRWLEIDLAALARGREEAAGASLHTR